MLPLTEIILSAIEIPEAILLIIVSITETAIATYRRILQQDAPLIIIKTIIVSITIAIVRSLSPQEVSLQLLLQQAVVAVQEAVVVAVLADQADLKSNTLNCSNKICMQIFIKGGNDCQKRNLSSF